MLVAAIPLHMAHRLEAERLQQQVRQITADPGEANAPSRMIDKRELRGWPVAGRGIRGAIDDTIPGHNLGLFDE
jgi:hypothetical protein